MNKVKKNKKVVDSRYAKSEEYKRIIKEIENEGKCPFCPENFKYHKHPVLKERGGWMLTKSSWPYKDTKQHLLIIGKDHKEHISEMSSADWESVNYLSNYAVNKFSLKGGVLALRFGDTVYTGATVCHLHFHLIAPQARRTVLFPIG